jgi:maltose alpha-D-glucosyltransferase / alpha-amylase
MDSGTLFQAYLSAFDPRGLAGLQQRAEVLQRLGISGIVTQPTSLYDRASADGPYSPLDHKAVDTTLGGEALLTAVNAGLRGRGITPIGDLVLNHADVRSELVQRALRDPKAYAAWFKLTNDPGVLDTWQQKINIFGLPPILFEPAFNAHRASTFYGEQWEFDVSNPDVIRYFQEVAELMTRGWGYGGLRLDAIAYAAATRLHTATGEHEPAGLAMAVHLKGHLRRLARGGPVPFLIAEAGGYTADMAKWLAPGGSDLAYDFTWMPTLIQSLDDGHWGALDQYWETLPETVGRWIRFGSSHDERQLRYTIYKEQLRARHGGPDGRYVCFGGNGLTLPVRNLVPSEEAFVTFQGLTILSDGVPLIFQTDMGGWKGDVTAAALDPRDPNRCLVPWSAGVPRAGWPVDAQYPLDPEWQTRSVQDQMADPGSVMSRLAQLITLRRDHHAIGAGRQVPITSSARSITAFARTVSESAIVVVANASAEGGTAELDLSRWTGWRIRRLVRSSAGQVVNWSGTSFVGHGAHEVGIRPHGFEVLELFPPMANL